MSALAFDLPAALEATEPPEARGIGRDEVRLLVASGGGSGDGVVSAAAAGVRIEHRRFLELPALLVPGDLLVVNDSATLPAAVSGRRAGGEAVRVHVSTTVPGLRDDAFRVLEVRSADGARPERGRPGERIRLLDGGTVELVAPCASGPRLWLARFDGCGAPDAYLQAHGEPIRYGYVRRRWPLSAYQNVYAAAPGSAEMPSAGRPFTVALLSRLRAAGVRVAALTLHTGVSSPERHEPPFAEPFAVPEGTAELVRRTAATGGRVIAVGTTVVRALESAAAEGGEVRACQGWTGLVIGPDHRPSVVDGLITGWHEPEASHLMMLEALAGRELVARSYDAALEAGYLWHEFGDSHLVLASQAQVES